MQEMNAVDQSSPDIFYLPVRLMIYDLYVGLLPLLSTASLRWDCLPTR